MDSKYIMSVDKMKDSVADQPYIEQPWDVIQSYFKGQHLERLVRHQIESYNNFVECQIDRTIEMFNPTRIVSEQDYDIKSGHYSLEIFVTFEKFNMSYIEIHIKILNLYSAK